MVILFSTQLLTQFLVLAEKGDIGQKFSDKDKNLKI